MKARVLLVGLAVLLVSGAWAAPQLPNPPDDGLHADTTVLAGAGIRASDPPADGGWDLAVVPRGQARPRAEVFKDLGLDEVKMRGRRMTQLGKVIFLVWQVSPSYDLQCMTAVNDPANRGRDQFDPARLVYGVRLLSHAAAKPR